MPIPKKEIDDKTIAELWGPGKPTPPADSGKKQPDDDKKPIADSTPPVDDGKKEAHEAQERIEKLMEKHGFDDFEELVEALEDSEEFVQKLGNRDFDQLIKDADYLETMTRWQADPSHKKVVPPAKTDDDEGEDDRISRLEKTIQSLLDEKKLEHDSRTRKEESERIISGFNNLVTSTLKEQEVPEEHRPFLAEFLGVNHPTLDVDLDNKVAVRKALKSGLKKYNDFVTSVINGYREGKIKIPEITPTNVNPPEEPKKVENLKHARKIMMELFSGNKRLK